MEQITKAESYLSLPTSEEQHKRAVWRGDGRIRSRNTDALIMVDILTKFTQVVPLKGKKEPDILEGIEN